MSEPERADEKVNDEPERRQFTPEYKLRIFQEIDQRHRENKGVIEETLRREGLYASQVASWRASLEEVIAKGLPERKRGRKVDPALTYKKQAEKLERQLKRKQEDLRQTRLIIEAQQRIAQMYTPTNQKGDGETG